MINITRLILDACSNHNGSRGYMHRMIKTASEIGADIIKWQLFNADLLNKNWPDYQKSYEYYKSVQLSDEDVRFIIEKCQKYNIEPLFTAFHLESADYLASIGQKSVKIASPDANNWPLIDKCLDKFDRILISTGLHTHEEINNLINRIADYHEKVTLLHCVSLYPTPPEKVNLFRMAQLMKSWPSVGFSDHTLGLDASRLAMCLGVACVERHFTLDKSLPGKDHAVSSTPDEFRELVNWRDKVKTMMYCEGNPDSVNRKYVKRWVE